MTLDFTYSWPWISYSTLDFTFDPTLGFTFDHDFNILTLNLTFNQEFHIWPTFNPEFHIQPWIWFYILPWNLHLLVNCPIQWRTGYLTFKSQMDLNKRGGSHKVSRSTDGHNFFIFHPRALNFWYVGANVLNERCTKFQVRSFILSSTTNFTFSSDFTKNLFSFTFFLFERFFHHWLQRKTNRNKWQKCLLWLLE